MNDLVSIVIPVYNGEKFILRCINNILKQTYENIEIIVINDGSTDNTQFILSTISNGKVKIININNSGVSNARNVGIKNASGKYILFVDADDYINENTVEILYNKIIQTNVDIIRYNGYIENKKHCFKKLEFPIDSGLIYDSNIDCNKIISLLNNPMKCIRCYSPLLFIKNKNIIPFNTKLSYLEDKLFYMENLLNNKRILFVDFPLYYYTYNFNSKTKNIDAFLYNLEDILASKKYIIEVAKNYKFDAISEIDSSYANLIMYRLDYLVGNSKYKTVKILLNKIMLNDKILESLIFDTKYISFYKRIQLFLLKKQKFCSYFIITKAKNIIKK